MRDLIQSFKYGDRHEGVPLFGRWMAAAGAELLAGADVIVPVPLYRSRLWSRRFNQSAMLAQEVGKLTGVPVDCFLLARVKRTQAQVGLTAAQRRKNVAGAFRVTAAKGALREKRIVVVDDVITTGATAEACARVLKRAGAARVDILALARAVEPSAHAAIVWNLRGHTLTYAQRPNGRSSGTSMTRVVLYTTPYCGYCRAAKHLLGKKGVTSPRST